MSAKLSRRDFLRFGLKRWKLTDLDAPAEPRKKPPPKRRIPVHRPPGAIEEESFLEACTKCDLCAEACPHDAIVKAPARFREAAGTPMITPQNNPCLMCEDTPCITACPEGALLESAGMKMGSARIDPFHCLAHQNTFCSVCVERCPVDDAIRMENGRPVIDPEICTGCGVCAYVCPAPTNAIAILPEMKGSSKNE